MEKTEKPETSSVEVERRSLVKESRLQAILNFLEANRRRELTVKEIAEGVGLDQKKTRKYLRLLRSEMQKEILFLRTNRSLVYMYCPTEEDVHRLIQQAKLRSERKRKTSKAATELEKEIELLEEEVV